MKTIEELKNTVIQGDCLEVMKTLPENSVDSIVTDPPYHLVSIVKRFGKENSAPAKFGTDGAFSRASKGFMGKDWDGVNEDGIGIAQKVELWKECLRVLKPGGHLLSFGGTRTYHRMASAIEDAGFEVRDMIEWVYGSGFPKSLNIGKKVDELQGNERKSLGTTKGVGNNNTESMNSGVSKSSEFNHEYELTKGTSEWEGWGTALKPAHEPICMARKPLSEKTVAENCLKYGTGGINIDESRVAANWKEERPESWFNSGKSKSGNPTFDGNLKSLTESTVGERLHDDGRFPANLIHDNSEEVRECFPESKSTGGTGKIGLDSYVNLGGGNNYYNFGDSGNASRFFKSIIYQPKASKSERNKGLDSIVLVDILRVWNENNTTKEEKLIRLMVTGISPQKVIAESGVQLKNANEWNTCLFGKHLMEKYQEDIKSITKTETNSITTSQTLNWLTHLLTNEYTVGANLEMENGGNLVENVKNSNSLIITINEAMALALGVKDVVSGTQLKISVKEGSNIHSTVKPIALMEYLIKMVTPKGGIVLDPFAGSGSTLVAAKDDGFKYIGIELMEEYIPIINARLGL